MLSHLQTTFGRNTLSTSQELDRVQERADKTTAELRRTQAELRVTQVCTQPFYFAIAQFIYCLMLMCSLS